MWENVLGLLPVPLREEIRRLSASRLRFAEELSEIRLRAPGRSSLLLGTENVLLSAGVGRAGMQEIFGRLCHGSLYAFRDGIGNGYLPMAGGIRVGICGQARYEGGRLIGVSDVSSLVFRLPHPCCDTADLLYETFERGIGAGMLLYSPPGVGKTTALRALAGKIGSGRHPRRVAVIDERCEFAAEEYENCTVDLLRGYRRPLGIEIATRTLSPEVLMVDEIGGEEEAAAMLGVLRAGVPLIATAHAGTLEEAMGRPALRGFLAAGVFDVFVGLSRTKDGFSADVRYRAES